MESIVFFDGYCGLCNNFVDFLIRKDKKNKFKFASLQGQTAKRYIPNIQNLETVIYYSHNQIHLRSTAVIKILIDLNGVWKIAYLGFLIPTPIRDYFYRIISKNRYKLWKKKEICRMPSASEQNRILP